ncbi:hypothetical protein [Haloarcula brevis]|uniref:hypothetical protein n=1 Tax=Haloarcula brevis TaxID=3111453 RepID=UPI00387ED248
MTVRRFEVGDRIRVDIPDSTDPDFDELHGKRGEVAEIIEDNAGSVTGDERDSVLYRVSLDSGKVIDVRWRDLRPSD